MSRITLIIIAILLSSCDRRLSHLDDNEYLGMAEATVRADLGQVGHEFDGHYGNPPTDFTDRFVGPIKTLVFERPDGSRYVSFEERAGKWICISSSWLPMGAAFR